MSLFRHASINDYEQIKLIQNQVHTKHVNAMPSFFRDVENSLDQEFFDKEIKDNHVLVLENDHAIIGYAFIHFVEPKNHPLIKEQKILFIDDFGIHCKFKRNGYGRKLFNLIEEFGKSMECTSIELSVWHFNQEAKEFYLNMDMQEIMIRMKKEIT